MQNLTINNVNGLSDCGVRKNANYLSQIDIENSKDEALVKVFVNEQSEDAFTELVNRYSDKVYRLAYRITGNPDDAKQVLQEVFIILVEKLWSDIPEYKLLSIEGTQLIEKAINQLPEDYKIVFHMKDVEGLTSREIAKVLGLSLPAVKSRVLRARLFLRDKLSDYYFEWDKN